MPLSVPLQTPQLSLLRSLRLQADQLSARIEKLVKLEEQLKELPDEPRWDALVPVPSSSSLAYARGNITNTNTVMVHFDIADGTEEKQADIASGTAGQGYWVEYSAKQARGVARRRRDGALLFTFKTLHITITEARKDRPKAEAGHTKSGYSES